MINGVILLCLFLVGCSNNHKKEDDEDKKIQPARIEKIQGSETPRVILTDEASKRIALHTSPVTLTTIDGTERTTVPYSAILYDVKGKSWVYKKVEPLIFMRIPVTIDTVKENVVVLVDGPPQGTEIVSVGGSELFGAEFLGPKS